jgi:hypothetical protein
MKLWLISSNPDADPGDTTLWLASFWEFCAAYCTARFGEAWCLSPEQSLMLHAESTTISQQVVVQAARGTNNTIRLPFDTSLYELSLPGCAAAAAATGDARHQGCSTQVGSGAALAFE